MTLQEGKEAEQALTTHGISAQVLRPVTAYDYPLTQTEVETSQFISQGPYKGKEDVLYHTSVVNDATSYYVELDPRGKPIIIVSDLHKGEEERNKYNKRDLAFFKHYGANYRRILNGDIFDRFEMPWKDIENTYPELIEAMADSDLILGNHESLYLKKDGTVIDSTSTHFLQDLYSHEIRPTAGGIRVGDFVILHGTPEGYFTSYELKNRRFIGKIVKPFTDWCFPDKPTTRVGKLLRGGIKKVDVYVNSKNPRRHLNYYERAYQAALPFIDGTYGEEKWDATIIGGHLHNHGSQAYILNKEGKVVHMINLHRDGELLYGEITAKEGKDGVVEQTLSIKTFHDGEIQEEPPLKTFYYVQKKSGKFKEVDVERFNELIEPSEVYATVKVEV
jgi:hypothetical protein